MLQEIKTRYGAGEALLQEVKKAEALIEKYGWQDMTIAPWSKAEPLMKYIGWLKDYSICTTGTKDMLISLWNGMAKVLNAWEQHELEKTVRCRIIRGPHAGEERMYAPWMAQLLVEGGEVELI